MIEESTKFLIERAVEELEKINIAGTVVTVAVSMTLKLAQALLREGKFLGG